MKLDASAEGLEDFWRIAGLQFTLEGYRSWFGMQWQMVAATG